MDISAIQSLYKTTEDTSKTNYITAATGTTDSFSSILNAMTGMVDETNTLQNKASAEEVKFALGESDNTHDLMIAEQKALIALQYTVAVRDGVLDAYKEIMNMSI